MSDFGDYDEAGMGYGDDWMYVEDYWDEANELAEYTCPSPVPFDDLSVTNEDYDVHNYWQDIEYISDGGYYEDHRSPKRKRNSSRDSKAHLGGKKRRKNIVDGERQPLLGMSTVKFVLQRDRNHSLNASFDTWSDSVSTPVDGPVALLKDWKERFKDTPGLGSINLSEHSSTGDHQHILGAEGFDLSDPQSVAGLLDEENMEALQKMLEAQGLDPEALELVIQDLLEGKERTFEDDSETEEKAPDEKQEQSRPAKHGHHGSHDHEMDDLPASLQTGGSQTQRAADNMSISGGGGGGGRGPDMPSRGTRSKRKARPDMIVPDESPGRSRKKRKH